MSILLGSPYPSSLLVIDVKVGTIRAGNYGKVLGLKRSDLFTAGFCVTLVDKW